MCFPSGRLCDSPDIVTPFDGVFVGLLKVVNKMVNDFASIVGETGPIYSVLRGNSRHFGQPDRIPQRSIHFGAQAADQ